ncbi:glycosyl transferase family 2 [Krasilnikovia cinnamomea]|uniref:Glycosyl transferase family 2 n=1 Tax=Krasilnikovia cinnamomea TaxID=349313 RepID=A0A4Q7ZU17_9ACTN|nr:glycosyltransferase [Krasilnikovia cinnamomea]RZU54381.1 glycosyl transferase family 2 [Krasilnikovia cinnamomea]
MKISFVVPTRNSARTLEACLGSLRGQTHPEVEVVVIDNSSTDGTAEIGRRLAHTFEQWGPERSAQRNRGTAVSTGDVVVFIDSDMVLEPHVATEIAAKFAADEKVGALIIPERSFGEGFLARCRELEKNLYVGDPGVEAARAFRRPVIEKLGGWNEALTAAEDWDLADRTRAAGVKVGRVEAWIWHDEGRIKLRATFAKKRYYGRWIDQYVRMHADTGKRKFVRTSLLKQPTRLLRHPVLTVGLATLKLTEAGGLLLGVRDSRAAQGTS